MNENENVGFDDFENALFGGDYQIDDDDSESEAVETEDTEDGDLLEDSVDDSEFDDDEESEEEDAEDADEEDPEPDTEEKEEKADEETAQTFTLKVNKEERQVTLEEMTALAQMGADYGRVKDQYSKSQQTVQDLQAQLDVFKDKKEVLDILDIVAEKTGAKVGELAEMLYISVRKKNGASEEVAKEELKSAKLERELNGMKAKQEKTQTQQQETAESRAQREIEAFRKEYPDVQLTGELVNKLTGDLQKGISLTAAYRKLEKAEADAKIADLEKQLAAKKQNDKNKQKSPGSQKDSGGRRTGSDYDDFERALFG